MSLRLRINNRIRVQMGRVPPMRLVGVQMGEEMSRREVQTRVPVLALAGSRGTREPKPNPLPRCVRYRDGTGGCSGSLPRTRDKYTK